jgi:hypothetical protein
MYSQVTIFHVPLGGMAELRRLIQEEYLPAIYTRPGFIGAYLLEQVDDPDTAQMVQFWDNHASVESLSRTGLLESSVQMLAARLPGLRMVRQGYVVRLATSGVSEAASVATH